MSFVEKHFYSWALGVRFVNILIMVQSFNVFFMHQNNSNIKAENKLYFKVIIAYLKRYIMLISVNYLIISLFGKC